MPRIGLLSAVVAASLALTGTAHAQRVIVNPSFESNDPQGPGGASYEIYPNGSVAGWDSVSGEIELWDSGFNGVPAYDGAVFAEMNANVPGALYQNICMVNGETIGWTFAHRARSGGPATQTARFQIANSSGTLIQLLATQASTTANQVWNVNTGTATYSGASGVQRVQFITTDAGSYGNFLDDIRISLNPFVELSAATGAGVESIPSANIPALRVSGTLFSARTVNVSITGGSATRGTDYTTPGGGASFTVTIPAGTYQNTTVPLGITIIDDTATEGSETIQIALSTGAGYTVSSTASCGGAPITAATYTITDNDSPVVLAKAWTNGIAADAVSLAITGGLVPTAGSSTVGGTTTNATAVAVAGSTLTLTEAFTTGAAANYTSSLECRRNSDNAVVATAGTGLSRTVTMPSGTSLTCTWTNARKSATLVVRKTWVNAQTTNAVTVQTADLLNNASLSSVANSANETDTNAAVTVYAAEAATLSESWSVGSAANYTSALACTGNATALAGSVLTVNPADTAIVCTFTNSRILQSLRLAKAWSGGATGHTASATTSGGTANPTFSSTAPTATTGTAVTVRAGDVVTLPAESYGGGAVAALYNASVECTGGSPLASGAAGRTLTIQGNTTATTCTYTNAYVLPLAIAKTSVAYSDPQNGTTNPKLIPGGFATYSLTVTAPAGTQATSNSVIVTDALPANLALFVGTYAPGPGPLAFAAGSSGLTYSFTSLASTSDDVSFSNNNGVSFAYTPVADANGVDTNITHIRINPKGSMAPGSSFTINLRAMVE
ncbi:MAG: Calx-beta domain-containing protein [Sphingopyxis sp.]|uniref:Calx-beta domain-containing protein n=1 Tax=Sphingopyxis sp. TaxID=1908224 RepID=UPI003D6CE9B4